MRGEVVKDPITLRKLHEQLTALLADSPELADCPVVARRVYRKGKGTRTAFHAITWGYSRHGTTLGHGGIKVAELNMAVDSIDGKEYA